MTIRECNDKVGMLWQWGDVITIRGCNDNKGMNDKVGM